MERRKRIIAKRGWRRWRVVRGEMRRLSNVQCALSSGWTYSQNKCFGSQNEHSFLSLIWKCDTLSL